MPQVNVSIVRSGSPDPSEVSNGLTWREFLDKYPYCTATQCRTAITAQGHPLTFHMSVGEYYARGGHAFGMSRYQIAKVEGEKRPAPIANVNRAASGAPTAKQHGLACYVAGMERDLFVAKMAEHGVKEVTAKTLFSDIKAGRIQ